MPARLNHALRRLSAPDRFADSLRVLLAMGSVMLLTGANAHLMIALELGVIAAALAETDDGWKPRLRALLGTLACFLAAAFTVELLFDRPWAFAAALAAGSFILVMMGAASPRHGTIAMATLLLAVYTMIGMDQPGAAQAPLWREPLLLAAGAAWYGVVAIAWSALFVQQPVRVALGRLYDRLGDYIDAKAQLFEPLRDLPVAERRAALARHNARVVEALNACRLVLIDRLGTRRPDAATEQALQLYLTAQDIHERASSSHYPYQALTDAFFHTDVMFRCQRLAHLLADACHERAGAVRLGRAYRDDGRSGSALADLDAALARLPHTHPQAAGELHMVLDRLRTNLAHLQQAIRDAESVAVDLSDRSLQDPSPVGLRDVLRRVALQLTPAAARFRHALRLGLGMLAGYGLLRLVHPEQGYWILLTVMLVCQPNYGATRTRLVQRITGTMAGLVLGWALLRLFPSAQVQMGLTVAVGVLFFVARYRQYLLASAAVTVFVLLAFNQIGNGFELIVPRLIDTVLGGLVAVAVTFLVLPDWRERELRLLFALALEADARYLQQILAQYAGGKRDDLPYRVARRDAHNADATLSEHLASALADPAGQRIAPDRARRLLVASQELIGHLSTLGAHRQPLPDAAGPAAPTRDGPAIIRHWLDLAAMLREGQPPAPDTADAGTRSPALVGHTGGTSRGDDATTLVTAQIHLLRTQLPALRALAGDLARTTH